jgi:hypothetical protein
MKQDSEVEITKHYVIAQSIGVYDKNRYYVPRFNRADRLDDWADELREEADKVDPKSTTPR